MQKATILIVDDEATILSSLSKLLSPNYQVRAVNAGMRAMTAATTLPYPDLILLDVMMPDTDGASVLIQLKENPKTCNIPVIFVTAKEGAGEEEKGLELGAVDYIIKPINPAILLARVKTQLSLKQARDFLLDKNDYLEKEIARRMKENITIQNVSIRALAHLAETRDTDTGDHILRTQAYVKILAKFLKDHPRFTETINEHYISLITKSAPLHDIGKVGIPDNVLLKPGKLDADEWNIMKTHAALGAQAIESAEFDVEQPVEFFLLAKQIARSHHERWDGNGYPDGLEKENIPLSARLMAVADVFDALITKRVYKPAFSYEKAREIIIEGREQHFDPDITDAFIACYEQFISTAEKYQPEKNS